MDGINLITEFAFLNRLKKWELIIFYLKMIVSIILSNKIANYCGFKYDSSIPIDLNNILDFLLSGQILLALIFGTLGYVVLDYFISFWAYLISLNWNEKIWSYVSYKKELVELDIIELVEEKILKGKNYESFENIIKEISSISKLSKSVVSLFIFSAICIVSYDIGNKYFHIFLLLFSLNLFINLVFMTVKLRKIKYNNKYLIKDINLINTDESNTTP